MSYSLVQENFSSISEALETINSRPNNHHMRDAHSSSESGSWFSGTSSYEEAVSLLKFGYTEPIVQVKEKLRENKRVSSKLYSSMPRPIPRNKVVGSVPNIPNALRGLPESMIAMDKTAQKRRTLSIMYGFGSSAGTDKNKLLKAGVALVSAISIIELSGIQTKLLLGFMPSQEGEEVVFPTIQIKNFGERFNLQKICFPMIHPSMFRRIGFKYLETCPLCKADFSSGYGCPPSLETLRELIDIPQTKVINSNWIIANDFSVEKILKEMGTIEYGN